MKLKNVSRTGEIRS